MGPNFSDQGNFLPLSYVSLPDRTREVFRDRNR
jgi:hypothetical protein